MRGAFLAAMAADPGFVDELVAAARARSPEVARLPVEENRRHIALLFAAGMAAFRQLADPTEDDFASATRLGADRAAQGVPLGALVRGVQAARTRALELAVDRGRAAAVPDDVLLEAALDFDRYCSALERHVIDGYHAAERELVCDRRTALLRQLLLGGDGDGPPDPARLAAFGLHPGGRYHCVVLDTSDPALLGTAEQRGGLFGAVEGRVAGLTRRPPSPDLPVAAVVAPALPIGELRQVYPLCVAALPEAGGVRRLVDLAGEVALATQPRLARLLRDALLGGLDPADEFHRELVSTAAAYLDHGQRLDLTAADLHVHPNTVRYRLRRMRDLTGFSDTGLTVLQTVRWWWALRTWLSCSP